MKKNFQFSLDKFEINKIKLEQNRVDMDQILSIKAQRIIVMKLIALIITMYKTI